MTPKRKLAALRRAVLRKGARSATHRNTVPVPVGPPKSEEWQVEVHEFEAPRGLYYAWFDTSGGADPGRIVVVKAGADAQSAKAAVEMDMARRLKAKTE